MDGQKKLGVFWGSEGLYFVESEASASKKILHFPFGETEKIAIKKGPLSTSGLELSYAIKDVIKKNKFENYPVNISLPTQDIIFRSFMIPWMQQHEIKSVVEFEASKYIPFSLEKLVFSFHPITITENATRRMLIIFVAIKSDLLSHYTRFLEDASLSIGSIEPAASSLIRTLNSKGFIPKDETVALIEKEDVGRIVIIDNEIPQFVREFHLSAADPEPTEDDAEDLIKKMTGEVRISLDYFNRQNSQLQVKKLLLLSSSQPEEISQALEKNLSLPVTVIDHASILNDSTSEEFGFLNAYGASIIDPEKNSVPFNLSVQKVKKTGEKARIVIPKKPFNVKSLIATALVCIPLIVGSIIVSGFFTQRMNNTVASMTTELGSFQDSDISFIEERELELKIKVDYYEGVRMDSGIALFLLLLPDLLPEGIWTDSLMVTYDDSGSFNSFEVGAKANKKQTLKNKNEAAPAALSMVIQGFAYSENRNRQFQLVNQLLQNLKNKKEFSDFFDVINLKTTQSKKIGDHPVTSFTVVCKKNDNTQRP